MTYNYNEQRSIVFSEHGQTLFLSIRDRAQKLLDSAGAFTMVKVMNAHTGSTWDMMACVDRLVELGEIRELTPPNSCAGQHRVFVAKARA